MPPTFTGNMLVLHWNLQLLLRQYLLHHGCALGRPISHTSVQAYEIVRTGDIRKGFDVDETDAQILRAI